MGKRAPIRLPRQWPKHVKSGVLHAISLAGVVVAYARGRVVNSNALCEGPASGLETGWPSGAVSVWRSSRWPASWREFYTR